MRTANHLHRELLEATAGLIMERDRRGLHTTLLKVRAHIGVRGNEIADSVAKLQAHRGMEALLDRLDKAYLHMAQQDEDVSVEVGRAPPQPGPFNLLLSREGDASSQDGKAQQEEGHRVCLPSDQALKDRIAKVCATYGSNTQAAHYTMLQAMNDPALGRHAAISSGYMTGSHHKHADKRV